MEFLIALAFLWILWLVSPRQARSWFKFVLLGLATIIILVSPVGIRFMLWGLTVPLQPDAGQKVDAIVVLGRGDDWRDERIAVTKELWNAKRAPKIFASGMLDARFIVETLSDLKVPGTQVSGEECSESTEENALFSATILHPQRVKTVLLVTDQAHILRSALTFQSFGFQVVPHPVPIADQVAWEKKLATIGREYVGLVNYAATGKLKLRTSDASQKLTILATTRIKDWNCQVNWKRETAKTLQKSDRVPQNE
ncbi:MAG: YdcF family protein [Leptolyngbyaceae cyanobacterium bins.59]|nr:YdcF family protein [Leptolyngbyaceae cyanobacterium bins.59]